MAIGHLDRIKGCLLGGAIGDALGAPVEFWRSEKILATFGPDGVQGFHPVSFGGEPAVGLVTDDTQMTLFTVEGLMRAQMRGATRGICHPPSVVHHAYQRWWNTQRFGSPEEVEPSDDLDGWLGQQRWLYSRRAPGNTCLSALEATRGQGYGQAASNNSKGCGGVMRSAPFGLYRLMDDGAAAVESAALTHGHPTGQLASGALAILIEAVCAGERLAAAVDAASGWLSKQEDHQETLDALVGAVKAKAAGDPGVASVEALGEGWIAEEALAIAVYCALVHPEVEQFRAALSLAVSHSGDSDSTGSICGNILGALHGTAALPADLVREVEGRETIEQLAEDMWVFLDQPDQLDDGAASSRSHQNWWDRYPGW